MNPNDNVMQSVQPAMPVEPVVPVAPAVPQPEKKKSNTLLLLVILFAVLAAGGIGFGVWAFMNGNSEKDKLNSQITNLRQEITILTEKNAELQETIDNLKSNGSSDQGNSDGTSDSTSTDNTDTEEGYHIISIGECALDNATDRGGSIIIKCDATTKNGTGKFVYSSESNELKFVVSE